MDFFLSFAEKEISNEKNNLNCSQSLCIDATGTGRRKHFVCGQPFGAVAGSDGKRGTTRGESPAGQVGV